MFNPLLAYPRDVLDPGVDDSRDEGEARLKLLRPVLHMAAKTTLGLTHVSGPSSFTAKLVDKPALEVGAYASVFKSTAEWKPVVRLAALSTMLLAPEVADTASNERNRVTFVPVRGSNEVAAINFPPERLPAGKLVMRFPRRQVGSVDAHVEIKRAGTDGFKAVIYSGKGKRADVSASGVATLLLDRLFAPSLPCPEKAKLIPALPDELPLEISSAIADFWQRQKRCHCLAAALAPEDSTRPLAFESITVSGVPMHQPDRVVVRCKLHASSMTCACALQGLPPMSRRFPAERFTGESEVDLSLSMCGRKRPRRPDGSYGDCPLHGAATPEVELVPGICCSGTVAQLGCSHTTGSATKRTGRKSGLWMPDLALTGLDVVHAQALIAGAWHCRSRVAPMLGKRPREDVAAACEEAFNAMRHRLAEIDRRRALAKDTLSEAAMIERDISAVDMLRAKDVRRHVRPTTKHEVLARVSADGSVAVLGGDDAKLVDTHLGLFPAPPKRGKGSARR